MQASHADVQQVLEQLVATGSELGIQVAAYHHGRLVLDAWAGVADPDRDARLDGRTLFWASSTAKGITATCAHMLAERGQLDDEAPVARYWPEFAANGKAGVTVRHVLSHTAGVPYLPEGFDLARTVDWEATVGAIAELPLSWAPGSTTGYHNYTFGFIVGELVRRIDGRPIADFVQDEICTPLEIDSLFFGVPESELERVARRVPDNEWNRRELRRASVPSSGLFTSAGGLARFYAALAEGGALDGVRLLSPERIALASQVQTYEMDVVYNVKVRRGLGYRLGEDTGPGAGPRALGHVGAGMFGYADPPRHFAMALVKNFMDSAHAWDAATAVVEAYRSSMPGWPGLAES